MLTIVLDATTQLKTRYDYKSMLERFYREAPAFDLNEDDLAEAVQEHLDIAEYDSSRGYSWDGQCDSLARAAKEDWDLQFEFVTV